MYKRQKYRGSTHGTNEFPFLIDETGFSVLPITSLGLDYQVSSERISSGIPRLDTMLSGKGYFRGSSILVSGTAGAGKSSSAASFAVSACERGEKVLYFAQEESPNQIIRNMLSIGIDFEPWVKKGLLQFHSIRPTFCGLEMHLATMFRAVNDFNPKSVILDPINSFIIGTNEMEAKLMMIRLIDYLKLHQITGFFTSLTNLQSNIEQTDLGVSSLIDTWLLLRDIELGGERNRGLYILKSRGMKHSNQIREFLLTDHGVELMDVYVGPEGVLTGSARSSQESKESALNLYSNLEIQRKQLEMERKRKAMLAQIELIKLEFEKDEAEALKIISTEQERTLRLAEDREEMGKSRQADAPNKESIEVKP